MKRYYITDRKSVGGFRPLLDLIRDQMRLGVDYIQIREKDVAARELFEFARTVIEIRGKEIHAPLPTKILLNSRSDIAVSAGCDGVHLPASAPAETLPGLLIARSCHTVDEVRAASGAADFVTLSPVFDSPGKGAPLGLEALQEACHFGKPVFALGGVNWINAQDCMRAGALGIAGIRLFQDPGL